MSSTRSSCRKCKHVLPVARQQAGASAPVFTSAPLLGFLGQAPPNSVLRLSHLLPQRLSRIWACNSSPRIGTDSRKPAPKTGPGGAWGCQHRRDCPPSSQRSTHGPHQHMTMRRHPYDTQTHIPWHPSGAQGCGAGRAPLQRLTRHSARGYVARSCKSPGSALMSENTASQKGARLRASQSPAYPNTHIPAA